MAHLIQYLIEQNIDKVRFVVLTGRKPNGENELIRTARVIKETCDKKGVPCYVVFAEDGYISRKNGKVYIHNIEDDKGFEINSQDTVVIVRGSVTKSQSSLDLLSQIERHNIFCVNHRLTLEQCADKYRTALVLADAGVSTPKTAIVNNEKGLEIAFKKMGRRFPVILKTLTGSKGVGVFVADSWEGLKSTLQAIWKINHSVEIIMQRFLEADYDLRVHVLGDKVIAAMKRKKIKGDFRSNYSLGGKVEKVELQDDEIELAIAASKAVGATWCGVDIMRNKKDKKLFVLEVNSSPGTEGIEKATGKSVVTKVVNYLLDKRNWSRRPIECGYLETMELEGIGPVEAKLDTGNGSFCVIHAEEYEVDGNKVTWLFNGKEITSELESERTIKVGGLKTGTVDRPVIWLDVKFRGETYRMRFALNYRGDRKTYLLMNRNFIRKANLIINPRRKHVFTKD
jgi:ribosomal protein S6--L-glutamate ligase